MEEPLSERFAFNWGRADAPWITTRSPHVLQDQTLNSTIFVKAVDKAGNEYIAKLVPEKSVSSMPLENMLLYFVLGFLALVVIVSLILIVRIFVKRRMIISNSASPDLDKI